MVQDYTNMSVQDKLKLADERLEKLKGTDKYDAFKERVDAMHSKYEPEITKLGQKLEKAGYSRDIANDATWDYKNNRIGLGPVATDRIRHEADLIGRSKAAGFTSGAIALTGSYMAGSVDAVKTSNAVRSATVDTAKGILQGARDTLAATVRQAGQKAVAEATRTAGSKIAGLTASAAGNLAKGNAAAEAVTHFGLTGEKAAENAKVATDAFKAAKTAQTELSAVKAGINTAGHNARVAAWNAGQKGLQTAAEQASQVAGGAVKAGRMAGLASGAKTFLKGNAASSFAIGGATSAIRGAIDLGGTIKATGGEGFGTAVKDTFTTKRGWKNLGLGFVGALRDVGNSMTFGAIENGDRTREKMMAAKGGEAPDLTGMSNFLATDKVPDTIFGIPIVSRREDYTEEDIAFFKEHPEAGGYYDMGEGTPEDGSDEGAPVQNDVPKSQLPSATFITGGRDEFDTVEMVQQALKNNYSAEQFLRMYYGDATDRIVGRAKELRGMTAQDMSTVFDLRDYQAVDRGSADPEARSLPRYASGGPRGSIVLPDLPIIAVGPGAVQTNKITKDVMTNIERATHMELPPLAAYENVYEQNRATRMHSRDAAVLTTQKQLYKDMEKWLKEEGKRSFQAGRYVYLGSKEDGPHEISHLLNPNEDLRYAVQYGPTYYLQNDAELAAAISAARREIFKRSGGKIDIADPRHMRAVLNEVKPGATDEETKAKRAPYEGRWLSTEARKFLYNYWTFKGGSRAADVNRKVVDPEFTGKLVSANRPRKVRV